MTASELLARAALQAPPSAEDYYVRFADYYERKLWHELTLIVTKYYSEGPSVAMSLVPLYSDFICKWQEYMNPLSLIKLAIETSRQVFKTDGVDNAIKLLEEANRNISQNSTVSDAQKHGINVLIGMETTNYRLEGGDLEAVKQMISSFSDTSIESLLSVDPLNPAT